MSTDPPRMPPVTGRVRRRALPSLAASGALLAGLCFAGGAFVAGQATEAARGRTDGLTLGERQVLSVRLWRGAGTLAALGLLLAGLSGRLADRREEDAPDALVDADALATGRAGRDGLDEHDHRSVADRPTAKVVPIRRIDPASRVGNTPARPRAPASPPGARPRETAPHRERETVDAD